CAALAAGLRSTLADGAGAGARTDRVAAALHAATSGEPLDVLGTLGRLRWDENGAPADATLESWCLEARPRPAFVSSGASFDVASQSLRSPALRCGETEPTQPATSPVTPPPPTEAPPRPPPAAASDAGMPDAAVPDASAEEPDAAQPDAGPPPVVGSDTLLTAVRRDNTWSNGYCDRVALYNFGDRPVEWVVAQTVIGTLTSVWSCKPEGDTGRVTFRGADWNRIVEPSKSTEFGYCAMLPVR
ncbi:MAG TPA: cellulose binding domain-containing protein, partial [Polyangiales bacterium]|nr:cellulose binding domain-containing protein [Polyangiales bacterium]